MHREHLADKLAALSAWWAAPSIPALAMVVRLWKPLASAAPVGKFHCSPVESGATVLWAAITTTNLGNMPFSSSTLMA
jgi:hypothetical protein